MSWWNEKSKINEIYIYIYFFFFSLETCREVFLHLVSIHGLSKPVNLCGCTMYGCGTVTDRETPLSTQNYLFCCSWRIAVFKAIFCHGDTPTMTWAVVTCQAVTACNNLTYKITNHLKRTECLESKDTYSQVTFGESDGTSCRLTSTHSTSVCMQSQLSGNSCNTTHRHTHIVFYLEAHWKLFVEWKHGICFSPEPNTVLPQCQHNSQFCESCAVVSSCQNLLIAVH